MPHLSFWLCLFLLPLLVAGEPPSPITAADLAKPGCHEAGRWSYTLTITNAGTRSEGTVGDLAFDGVNLPNPPAADNAYATPWGPVGWTGINSRPWGAHGWMPTTKAPQLPDPAATATLRLRLRPLDAQSDTASEPPTEDWIVAAIRQQGGSKVRATADWTEVGEQAVNLHDSKHYGQASIRRGPLTATDTQVSILLDGLADPTVPLPRRHQTRQVLHRTLDGSQFGSLELWFAVEVLIELNLPKSAIGADAGKSPFDKLIPDKTPVPATPSTAAPSGRPPLPKLPRLP